ncbi:recombinase RecT [Streptomyces griseoluteus]
MNQISNAIEKRDQGPEAIVRQHKDDLTLVLPSHVKGETWMRLAYGALRSNKQLMQTAARNPGSLMNALQECARLGHEPGTESYYLVPFGNEVQGIEGYRGVVERIYRAGAVKAVKAEVVHANDHFDYSPDMDRPIHKPDYFGDRGPIIGAYAYGVFQDGSTSKVVIIDRAYIDKVRKESKGSNSPTSPWVKWEDQMVLKTVAKRLEPWVPSSTEWRKEQLRAAQEVAAERTDSPQQPAVYPAPEPREDFNDDEPVEGELVD